MAQRPILALDGCQENNVYLKNDNVFFLFFIYYYKWQKGRQVKGEEWKGVSDGKLGGLRGELKQEEKKNKAREVEEEAAEGSKQYMEVYKV